MQNNHINEENIILLSDSYKFSHFLQYPPNMTSMFDYIEARGAAKGVVMPEVRFFGLQYVLKRYLSKKITVDMVDEAEFVLKEHGVPFDREGWLHIADKLKGKLPIRIRAIPEGTVVPHRNVLVTVESTDSRVPWVVGWAETILLKFVWYATTVCTNSYKIQQTIKAALETTCDNPESELPFKLQDFGYRGVSSEESAGIGGLAHLVNFMGTDTLRAITFAYNYYNAASMPGYSIPASEHSTMTSWGRGSEISAFQNMVRQFSNPGSIYAVVSDSYDYYNAVDNIWGKDLRQSVIDGGGTLVVRPDSGSPMGNVLWTLDHLGNSFGYHTNAKGYKVLNGVRVIQGDGVSGDLIYDILEAMKALRWSAENVAFGMGGALLQGNFEQSVNRDTYKFAMKCSHISLLEQSEVKEGEYVTKGRDVFKSPILDQGKLSKAGRLDLIENTPVQSKTPHRFTTVVLEENQAQHPDSVLRTVFENGVLLVDDNLENIRARY